MSELFGRDVSGHLMSKDVMKEDFGWEVPVEAVPLPSNGLLYDPNSLLYNRATLNIKAMTAHEEDILSSQALLKDGTAISHLIRSCITDKSINTEEMINGDRTALMVAIRITGYGSQYSVRGKCKNCSHNNDVTVDLSELAIKRLSIKPVEEGKNKFLFTLPVTKKKVIFKFLSAKDDKNRNLNREFIKKSTGAVDPGVTTFLEQSIVSVDRINDRNKIKHFIRYMPAFDSRSLRKFISENEPGIDMTSKFECSSCGFQNMFKMPITTEFFWPST